MFFIYTLQKTYRCANFIDSCGSLRFISSFSIAVLWIGSLDADPDSNFHFDADSDLDSDWHQNDADPHVDPSPVFLHMLENRKKRNLLLFTAMPVHNVFPFSSGA
jgi:hypothetical protein